MNSAKSQDVKTHEGLACEAGNLSFGRFGVQTSALQTMLYWSMDKITTVNYNVEHILTDASTREDVYAPGFL